LKDKSFYRLARDSGRLEFLATFPLLSESHFHHSFKSFHPMRKIIITTIFCSLAILSFGQQEQQYTQFMYNKLGFNPGYAGSHDAPTLTGIFRTQWMGLEGAPQTQLVNFSMPMLNKRVGVGLGIVRHTIGISERFTVEGSYAYRVRLGRGTLGIGVQASIRHLTQDYTDERIVATQDIGTDGSIPVGQQSKLLPNFGAGVYYNTNKFYFGISAPRFLNNNIDFSDATTIVDREVAHVYGMVGAIFKMSESIKLQPQILFKFAESSPFDADLNMTFLFKERYTAGVTYRVGGSSVSGAG